MHSFLSAMHRLVVDERGIQHVEEALLLALIGVAAIGIASDLGTAVRDIFTDAEECLTGVNIDC